MGNNSLIPAKSSLIIEIFSLLICVGNCAKSDCGAAVSCYEIGPGSREIAKFPVKFPVSREFAWRRVRSVLPRQPTSPDIRLHRPISRERPAFGGLSYIWESLWVAKSTPGAAKFPKVSGRQFRYSRFREFAGRDRVRSHCRPREVVELHHVSVPARPKREHRSPTAAWVPQGKYRVKPPQLARGVSTGRV